MNAQDTRSDLPKLLWALTLTSSTLLFCKAFLNYVTDLLKITIHPVLYRHANEAIVEGFKEQMRYLILSTENYQKPARRLIQDPDDLVLINITFHLEHLVPLAMGKYCEKLKVSTFPELQTICKEYANTFYERTFL